MKGHHHQSDPYMTQNQGNVLGDRPCVRQSKIYRQHCGGNAMKELLGQSELKWDVTQTQGCYAGGSVYDHNTKDHRAPRINRAGLDKQAESNTINNSNDNNNIIIQMDDDNAQVNNITNNKIVSSAENAEVDNVLSKSSTYSVTPSVPISNNITLSPISTTATAATSDKSNTSVNESVVNKNKLNQQQSSPQQQQFSDKTVSVSTGRGFRQGAGYANRQTYNIFTGK